MGILQAPSVSFIFLAIAVVAIALAIGLGLRMSEGTYRKFRADVLYWADC